MIARGLRTLAFAAGGVLAGTAVGSVAIGAAAGYSVVRSLSAGLVLVGALLFVTGGLTSFKAPRRSRSSDDLRTQAGQESFVLAMLLVAGGLVFVVLGIALDPETTL